MRRTLPLIAGGGPAGAAAAITLARAGAAPLLIERGHRHGGIVCGGFLGWDALASLSRLGIDAFALGAHPIERVRIIAGDRIITARLPHRAAGLSRDVLDTALLGQAEAYGAKVERGLSIRGVEEGAVLLGDGARLRPSALFIATGKHALRGSPRIGAGEGSVGMRRSIPGARDLAGVVELHLFRGGYAGLLLQEDGSANFCLSASAERLREAGGTIEAMLSALADEAPRLVDRGAGAGTAGWSSIAAVPYGWRTSMTDEGHYRIGDQAAVIASLVGDGVAIALASGRMAGEAFAKGTSAPIFQRRFASRAARPLTVAEAMRQIAERPQRSGRMLPWLARLPGAIGLVSRLTRIGH